MNFIIDIEYNLVDSYEGVLEYIVIACEFDQRVVVSSLLQFLVVT